jgi:diguanylate cyclase (GGDEF)-like protein
MDQSEAQPRLRAVTQRVFGRGRDPYIGNDLGNANRLVGLGWLVYGVFAAAVLSLTPPGDVLASTGWAVGAAMVASSFAVGSTLMRWRWAGFNGLLFVSYAMVLLMSVLDGYAPAGGAAYHELYLPIGMIVAASHPVRRVLVFIVFLTATALGSFALADPPAGGLADFSARIGIWCACAALLLVMMAQLRKQRMTIRNEASHARELARTDVLTGLGNRRRLIDDLEALGPELAAGRTHHLALFDLDGFKAYNDTYGHPAGDAVLRGVAKLAQKAARDTDVAARYGGEELALILPETDAKGALAIAERLRKLVETAAYASEQGPLKVTVSIGVSTTGQRAKAPADLLEQADRALYRAKHAGRNRVEGARGQAAA